MIIFEIKSTILGTRLHLVQKERAILFFALYFPTPFPLTSIRSGDLDSQLSCSSRHQNGDLRRVIRWLGLV